MSAVTGLLDGELLAAAGDDPAAAGEAPGEEAGIAFETPCMHALQYWINVDTRPMWKTQIRHAPSQYTLVIYGIGSAKRHCVLHGTT